MTKTVATNGSRRARKPILLLLFVALGALSAWGFERCEVEGASMLPELSPGDRVLLRRRRPKAALAPGTMVAFPDPRKGQDRLLIKRVASVDGAQAVVLGDNPASSTDSREFGPVALANIPYVVVRRYAKSSEVLHAR